MSVRFSKLVAVFAKEAKETIRRKRNNAVLSLHADIVNSTPVGDPELWRISRSWKDAIIASGYKGGTLKNNWVVKRGDINALTSTKQADSTGARAIGRAKRSIAGAKLEDTIFIANPIFYAYAIEYTDHSVQQGPGEMVRTNVLNWDMHVATV